MQVTESVAKLFGLPGVPASAKITIDRAAPSNCPAVDPQASFTGESVKLLLLWFDGIGCDTILVPGSIGTTLVEQFAARVHVGIYRVSRRDPDYLQTITTMMTESQKRSVLCMIDEADFLDPEFAFLQPTPATGLDQLVDRHEFTNAATGSTIVAGSGLRMAVVVSDSKLYHDTGSRNIVGYNGPCGNDALQASALFLDAAVLSASPFARHLLPDIVVALILTANEMRARFTCGQLKTLMTPRVLLQWAHFIQNRPWRADTLDAIIHLVKKSLAFVLLDRCSSSDQAAVYRIVEKHLLNVYKANLPAGATY